MKMKFIFIKGKSDFLMARKHTSPLFWFIGVILVLQLAACSQAPANTEVPALQLRVVATTTLVGDVVKAVAGDLIDLTVLMPPGVDPHSFDPVPQDIAAVAAADLIFLNGLGVEINLDEMIVNAGGEAQVLSVSEGITPFYLVQPGSEGGQANASEFDPHVWLNPLNVVIWAQNIAAALAAADPPNAGIYQANADAYGLDMVALDEWVQDQVAQVPASERLLVTDHDAFGYFARRYGFTLAGTVFPGFSTLAEPSAREVAELETAIQALDVRAIFVGNTVNPSLGERIAQDTGTRVVFLYTGSLSDPGGPAPDYPSYIRYNVTEIVKALTAGEPE